ncbi:MAG: thioredoxin family protein [Candidatus Bathyarchaeia archaeon]
MKITIYKADWCPHCQELLKNIEELRKVFDIDVEIIDVEENREIVEKLNIQTIPKIFVDSEEITYEELLRRLHKELK